ncbi:hypothetical protein CI610_01637 [invertebrate metagenome]|uniref:Anti sigma-E protein RseA N-terminal domain-containing protein n=1 Tax=invertebrate metagenome TaxID=1711999 RepID=A0A2H9T827_9ZZZZ
MKKNLEDHNHDVSDHLLMESLSAVIDNQSAEPELCQVLSEFDSSKENDIREKAQRYLMIGDVIRHHQDKFSCVDISSGVRRTLLKEMALGKSASPLTRRKKKNGLSVFLKSLADKWAEHWAIVTGQAVIAVSVAVIVVFSGNYYHGISEDSDVLASVSSGLENVRSMPDQTATLSQPIQMQSSGYAASGIRAGYGSSPDNSISPEQAAYVRAVADETTRERFKAYAFQHAGFSAMNGGQALLPFARLTSAGLQ